MTTTDEDTDWYITGPRLNVYHMVPFFLDARSTEQYIAESFGLTVEQIAKARSYVFNNFENVMKRHWEIEAEIVRLTAEQAKWYTREVQLERTRRLEIINRFLKARKVDPTLFFEIEGESKKDRLIRLTDTAEQWHSITMQPQLEVAS